MFDQFWYGLPNCGSKLRASSLVDAVKAPGLYNSGDYTGLVRFLGQTRPIVAPARKTFTVARKNTPRVVYLRVRGRYTGRNPIPPAAAIPPDFSPPATQIRDSGDKSATAPPHVARDVERPPLRRR